MPARKRGTGRTTPKGTKGPAKKNETNDANGNGPTRKPGRPPTNQRSTGRAIKQRPTSHHRGNR